MTFWLDTGLFVRVDSSFESDTSTDETEKYFNLRGD